MAATRNVQLARKLRTEKYDLVHAWGTAALTVAALIHAGPTVFSFRNFPNNHRVRWARAVSAYRSVHIVSPTTTLQKYAVERGVPIACCHLIRPGVEFGRVNRRRDPKLRMALGLAETDTVYLLPGEATADADHQLAVWAGSIHNVLGQNARLLLWGPGDRTQRLATFATQLNQPNMLAIAEKRLGRKVEFEELLPAADAVLVTASGSVATLPIAICMAAGLPIVSTVTSEIAELLEDRHTALMVSQPNAKALAQRMQDLAADKTLAWKIADMARTEAYEFFSHTRFINQYRALYRQVAAGETVNVPEIAPGAGLRFHGLG